MHESPHIPVAHIDISAICRNYKKLSTIAQARRSQTGQPKPVAMLPIWGPSAELSAQSSESSTDSVRLMPYIWPAVMPVIKADAYGHGHSMVASALMKEGASAFASGSVEEAILLREGLAAMLPEGGVLPRGMPATPRIVSLLGVTGVEDVHAASADCIITMLHSFRQLDFLAQAQRPHAVCIKCNSGMNRLGFNPEELPELVLRLREMPSIIPVMAASHFSSADSEQGRKEVRGQTAVFALMLDVLRDAWPNIAASIGNSAGTLLADEISSILGPHICRPGVALYGGNPFAGTSLESLGASFEQAMSVSTPVIAIRNLNPGDAVGYGRAFVVERPLRVAIIAAGYADFVSRSLSNKGVVCISGQRAPIVGRVAMQMIAVDVSAISGVDIGDTAWLLGGPHENAVTLQELADTLGTITYEVTCLLGCNTRVYV